MFSVRRRLWFAGAASLAALALQAPAGSAAPCSVGAGWDLFRTGPGTTFNPVAAALSDAPVFVDAGDISFSGVPIGNFDFGTGSRQVGDTDTIVRRDGAIQGGVGTSTIELVALQLQASGSKGLVEGSAPIFVTLQSQRGANPLDPPPGPPSVGFLTLEFLGCDHGRASAQLDVHFDVRVGSVTGPIVWSSLLPADPTSLSRLPLSDEAVPWTARIPDSDLSSCHLHTIRTGVHCILGPTTLIPQVNVGVPGGDFFLGA